MPKQNLKAALDVDVSFTSPKSDAHTVSLPTARPAHGLAVQRPEVGTRYAGQVWATIKRGARTDALVNEHTADGENADGLRPEPERPETARALRASALLRLQRQALLRLPDEHEIFAAACRFAVEVGRFRLAWIGLPDPAKDLVVPVVWAGQGATYLDALRVTLTSTPENNGPTGLAVRNARPAVVADIATDPTMAPWRERARAHGFVAAAAFPFRRADGRTGALSVYSSERGFDDPIELSLLEGVAEDIGFALDALDERTARARAEAALIESEQRHRAIFERASDGIFVADATMRYVDANPAGLALVGYTRDELLSLHLSDLVAPEDLATQPLAPQRFTPHENFVVERRLRRKDGDMIDVEISGVRMPDGSLQSVARDVSERKRMLAERAASERVASLGRLAQGVGHEINNPLAYLVLSLDLLRDQLSTLPPEIAQEALGVVGHIDDAAARIAAIVRSLSRFGRADTDTIGPIDLERSVRAAVAMTATRLNHVAEVQVELPPTPRVRGNEFQLTQVFVNLLLNAADAIASTLAGQPRATKAAHTVKVVCHMEHAHLYVDVSDDGPGISPAVRAQVFEPYVTTKPVGRGTGLGLSICKSIVESFGGQIQLLDTSHGTTFRLELESVNDVPRMPAPDPVKPKVERLRILVIDDEPIILRLIKNILRDHLVTTAPSPADALALCDVHEFDRIMCDLMFPGTSAEPFYDALTRTKPELAQRIVFMTGGAFTEASQAFLERAGRPRLNKPFSSQELLRCLSTPPP